MSRGRSNVAPRSTCPPAKFSFAWPIPRSTTRTPWRPRAIQAWPVVFRMSRVSTRQVRSSRVPRAASVPEMKVSSRAMNSAWSGGLDLSTQLAAPCSRRCCAPCAIEDVSRHADLSAAPRCRSPAVLSFCGASRSRESIPPGARNPAERKFGIVWPVGAGVMGVAGLGRQLSDQTGVLFLALSGAVLPKVDVSPVGDDAGVKGGQKA